MKRIILLILPVFIFTACKPEKDVPVTDITSAVIAAGEFPEMVSKTAADLEYEYDGFDTANAAEASFYVNPAGAYADNVTVVKMNTSADADKARAYFEKYMAGELKAWEDYQPKEAFKLKGAVITQKGAYVGMFICADADAAKRIFDDLLS